MNKENLLNYKMDYSVYILRFEKKRLGRLLKDNDLEQEEIEYTRLQIKQISDTLDLLKIKYGIKKNDTLIKFNNGSRIEVIEAENTTRGKMSNFIEFNK